jgi:hypothetical protein
LLTIHGAKYLSKSVPIQAFFGVRPGSACNSKPHHDPMPVVHRGALDFHGGKVAAPQRPTLSTSLPPYRLDFVQHLGLTGTGGRWLRCARSGSRRILLHILPATQLPCCRRCRRSPAFFATTFSRKREPKLMRAGNLSARQSSYQHRSRSTCHRMTLHAVKPERDIQHVGQTPGASARGAAHACCDRIRACLCAEPCDPC